MAWDATFWRRADASTGVRAKDVVVCCTAPVDGWWNMLSIVGWRAAQKGVDRNSVGRSRMMVLFESWQLDRQGRKNAPLMKLGMEPPVKNLTQSLVNELQLKSMVQDHIDYFNHPGDIKRVIPNKWYYDCQSLVSLLECTVQLLTLSVV